MSKLTFDAIGTSWEIDTPEPLPQAIRLRIFDRIERFDATYSRFRIDSLVTRISVMETGGLFEFPADAPPLFDFYDRLHAATDGAVDPLVGRDLELLGYDARYSLRFDPMASARYCCERRNWALDIHREGRWITTRRPVMIDVGAAGKGYLVDLVASMLRSEGAGSFVVDAGGDLLHAGFEPLEVGLEHPEDPALAIGIAHLTGQALCASATNRRAWGVFHHVIDGRTGIPARHVAATWVVAEDAMVADGIATALFFTDAGRLASSFSFSFVRMFTDGRAEISPNFNGELFTDEKDLPT